jgi:predicted acyltransferase
MAHLPTGDKAERLLSLDAFRGATIAGMLLVNNPGTWSAIYPPFKHAEWHGWTFTDLIFPFFLWIVGLAMTLSFAKRLERGDSRSRLMIHVLRRSVIIFALGLFLAGFPFFNLATIRIPGVLQRIALCYLIASFIYLTTRLRGQVIWTGVLLSLYWLLMKLYPVPGYGAGILEKEGNFAAYIDGLLLRGHMWSATKVWDPEGIVSTLPAIATVLFGILLGHVLRLRMSAEAKTAGMFVAGNILLFAGMLMHYWLPINKNLWTSSYSVFMAGMATTVFATWYWLIDVMGYRRWARPFVMYGMNAIAIFVLAGLVAKTMGLIRFTLSDGSSSSLKAVLYQSLFAPLAEPQTASLLYALVFVLIFGGVAWLMHRRRWFIKI